MDSTAAAAQHDSARSRDWRKVLSWPMARLHLQKQKHSERACEKQVEQDMPYFRRKGRAAPDRQTDSVAPCTLSARHLKKAHLRFGGSVCLPRCRCCNTSTSHCCPTTTVGKPVTQDNNSRNDRSPQISFFRCVGTLGASIGCSVKPPTP